MFIKSKLLNLSSRCQYGNGFDFKHEIIECRGNNCVIPTEGFCFVKCIIFKAGEDYEEQYLEVVRNEKRRSNIMTKARVHSFCRAKNIIIG